jgi:hypothetical protein
LRKSLLSEGSDHWPGINHPHARTYPQEVPDRRKITTIQPTRSAAMITMRSLLSDDIVFGWKNNLRQDRYFWRDKQKALILQELFFRKLEESVFEGE